MDNKEELLKCLEEKIEMGRNVVERLKDMQVVEGVEKLVRKIHQEIRFLEKVSFNDIFSFSTFRFFFLDY